MKQHISGSLPSRVRARLRSVVSHGSRVGRRSRSGGAPHGPRVLHADIPDGETLWLAVEAEPTDVLALRDEATGTVTALPTDTDPGTGSLRTARSPLLQDGEPVLGEDAVIVVQARSGAVVTPRPHRTDAGGGQIGSDVRKIPRALSGPWRFELADVSGALRVRRTWEAPMATVWGLDVTTSLQVRFSAPEGAHPIVVARGEGGEVIGMVECSERAGLLTCRIGQDTLDLRPGQEVDLSLDPEQCIPLVRRHDDLKAPNSALVLPVLPGEDLDHEPLQLRYRKDGRLILRRSRNKTKGGT